MFSARVTLRQIAERAGISLNTVSLALRNSPRLKPETREFIQQLAKEMGYAPNPVLAAGMAQLRSRRACPETGGVLALLHACEEKELQRWSGIRRIIKGCRERSVELGYRMQFWRIDLDSSASQARRHIHAMGVPGAIVVGAHGIAVEERIASLVERIPVVTCGGAFTNVLIHNSQSDHFNGPRLAVQKVLERGYRRPGLMVPRGFDEVTGYRIRGGYLSAIYDLPAEDHLPMFFNYPDRPKDLPEAMRQWWKEWEPDVILTNEKNFSLREWRSWNPLGEERMAGLVQLGHSDETQGWAGVTYPGNEVGRTAVDMVVAQIQRGEAGVPVYQKSSLAEGVWVEGESCPPVAP